MKLVFIATSRVPSTTANSIQVMKVCQAFAQLGHSVHLLIPQECNKRLLVDCVRAAFAARTQSTFTTTFESSLPQQGEEVQADLSSFYGLQVEFPVERLPANPRLRRYDFAWRAVLHAKALNAELVYVWTPQAALFALFQQMPVLLELHEPPSGSLGPLIFRLILSWPGHKRFLPITQALADLLARKYPRFGSAQGKSTSFGRKRTGFSVVVAPDGVDLERYLVIPDAEDTRRQLGLPEGVTAGYTGHLYPGRGMGLLVELARRFPAVHFLWVGGRPEDVADWKERLAELKINNITLTGFIANRQLPLYQAAADILLMPYERKVSGSSGGNTAGFASPMKMFEYMACERAIISSDLPVIGEVLNEHNAVLCPPEDVDAWADAFDTLLKDPEKGRQLARRARLDVEAYTWLERARRTLEGFHGS